MRILAHGIGSAHDLPISAFYAFAGAFLALLISFLGLALGWSRSRFVGERAGRPLPEPLRRAVDAPVTRGLLRGFGLILAGGVFGALLFGPDDPDRNPGPAAIYVWLWIGLVPASLLFGPVGRLISPLRTVHLLGCRLLRRDPGAGRALPRRHQRWPAAVGLAAFTWLELVSPDPAGRGTLLIFLTGYAVLQLAFAGRYGQRWFDRGEAFEAYSALFARLSPLGRRVTDGRLVVRSPLNSLDGTPEVPGLAAVVCVLLGSTAYDGFSDAPGWIALVQTAPLGRTVTGTIGLLAAIGLVALLYAGGAVGARLLSRTGEPRRPALAFAHSLIPIALGYFVAHYYTLFVAEAPRTLAIASGTSDPLPPEPPLGPAGVATLQVTAVIVGHVLGVVAAHDRSVRLLPPARAVLGQLPMLVLMVVYTVGGLMLLIT